MNTCDTCKFWGWQEDRKLNRKRCENSSLGDDRDAMRDDGLLAQGLYEDGAVIETGPKFGCVHHESQHPVGEGFTQDRVPVGKRGGQLDSLKITSP